MSVFDQVAPVGLSPIRRVSPRSASSPLRSRICGIARLARTLEPPILSSHCDASIATGRDVKREVRTLADVFSH